MNKFKLALLSAIVGSTSFAQNLNDAIKNTDNERYAVATSQFKVLIEKEATKAENYFFYGDNLFKSEKIDSAEIIWNKGITVNEKYALNYVGLGKAQWAKGNKEQAKTYFDKALSLSKKPQVLVLGAIAESYIYGEEKNLDEAISLLEKAIEIAPSENLYILLGDALITKAPSNGSPAVKNYNLALELNPKSVKSIVRKGVLYKNARNPKEANAKFNEAVALDPTYAPVYRELAQLNAKFGNFEVASENWVKYLKLNNDDDARLLYASSLFESEKFCDAITELENLKSKGATNKFINRMLAYAYLDCDQKNTDPEVLKKGETLLINFMAVSKDNEIIGTDFSTKARYALIHKDTAAAVQAYVDGANYFENTPKILQRNLQLANLYAEAGKLATALGNNDDIIKYYSKKKGIKISEFTLVQYYELGRAYYYGNQDYAESEKVFTDMATAFPNYPLAQIWIARNQRAQDKTKSYNGKDAYLKYFEIITPEDLKSANYKNYTLEASEFLAVYFFEIKDAENAKKYFALVKELDPTNSRAKAFYATPMSK